MKKKIIVLLGVLTLTAAVLAGCGTKKEAAETSGQDEKTQEEQTIEVTDEVNETGNEEEPEVGMANPWVEITEEDAKGSCPRMFKAPEGATVKGWLKNDSLGDEANSVGPLIELDFDLDGLEFTARAQYGVSEDEDISGIYAEWAAGPEDVTLANWGEGHMAGKTWRAIDDEGYTDLITWYDIEIGIKYSLCVTAEDLDGFDIQAIAEQMYSAENEPTVDMPD